MAVFKNKEMMKEIFGEIWNRQILETELSSQLRDNDISILYKITDPDMTIYIDGDGVTFDKAAETKTPAIIESLSGDTAHKFWLGKLDMTNALATKQIRARGSVTKLLRLLPLLKRVQKVYPEYCRKYELPMN